MGTEPLGALGGTCQIGQTGVERDISGVLDELIRCRVVTPMARTGNLGSAIENELDRKVDLFTLSLARNLDAIGESRDGTMSPARAAILRQMLVQRMGEVVGAIDVSPSEGLGKGRFADVLVRQSTQHMLGPIVSVENFDLVHPLRRGNPHGQGGYGGKEDLHGSGVSAAGGEVVVGDWQHKMCRRNSYLLHCDVVRSRIRVGGAAAQRRS